MCVHPCVTGHVPVAWQAPEESPEAAGGDRRPRVAELTDGELSTARSPEEDESTFQAEAHR